MNYDGTMPATISGYIGARFTNRFSDRSLRRIIGIVLIIVAVTIYWRVFDLIR
jgi:uncharacterized membrane protein YfcA